MKMNELNHALQRIGGGFATVLLVASVFGSVPALAAGITDTKHNLGTSNTRVGENKISGGAQTTAEICVFCHTPHGSDTSASVPLWNKKLGTPSDYTTYNSLGTSSLDGATAPVGSVSLACLSCHDGSQALNVMINAPGSGGYNSAGAEYGVMTAGTNPEGGLAGNKLAVGIITNLTKDLQNDHPVGIQYAGGPVTGTSLPRTAGTSYTDFKDKDFKAASTGIANNQAVWWVDASGKNSAGVAVVGTTAREKTDMQLYSRGNLTFVGTGGAAITATEPFVECASCHDPHSDNKTFLRISNDGSAVCLACHIK